MIEWERRPTEVANLLNPAFCGLLLREAIAAYRAETNAGMPFPLTFLVLPIVLHQTTRERLPRDTRTSMHVWLQENPEARLGFAERTRSLVPVSLETISFLLQHQALAVGQEGGLLLGSQAPRPVAGLADRTQEFNDCLIRARFVGRWLARSGSVPAVYQFWGIRP